MSFTAVLGGLNAESNMHSTIVDVIKPTRKLLSICRLKSKKLHLINVFSRQNTTNKVRCS